MGYTIVRQPGQLKAQLMAAGPSGPLHVVYQPTGGDPVEHWEHLGWLCLMAGSLIIVGDEVDMVCSAGSSGNAQSSYWKKYKRMAALEKIVQYGRHSKVAFVGIARAPQDVWRRLTGQCHRMIVFKMNERLEMEALRGRLGSHTDQLPRLEPYTYLDWNDETGFVSIGGGKQ
jgi:hypothetical protein